ncbi:protein NLRC3-like isoform X2 [Paramisgurnus dabryanus]|uniref:protein NLRC3-like isoform X2 n=1 Tax=Paramisgurnus dabryanus TaxID=90735 RepID=UPI003CCF8B2D
MNETQTFTDGDFSPGCSFNQQKKSDPESSCVSIKSNLSMNQPTTFKSEDPCPALSSNQQKKSDPESSCVSIKSNLSMNQPTTFKSGDLCPTLSSIQQKRSDPKSSFKSMMKNLSINQPTTFKSEDMCPALGHDLNPTEVLQTFKINLSEKFKLLCEGTSKQNPIPLNEIYTELYITENGTGEINNTHEMRHIETQSRRIVINETPIKYNDIFKPSPAKYKEITSEKNDIRSVLTKGVAGIGKTVSVQKFILDWAEGKANQDVHLIFPLPFRELNLMKDQQLSLLDLLHVFFPETKNIKIFNDEYKVLFIFDGLDENHLSLDFQSSVRLWDVSESATVDVLLTNLIKRSLVPSAVIWITSRPAAADLIPSVCVDRVTEVRGFSDLQKEEYFRKRIRDESLANRIISHLKSLRSLYIMCHIPVFCWIAVTVLERILSEAESQEIPKTLTQMYTHFLIIQTNIKHQKHYEKKDEDMIFKLGKLAFEQLVKNNLIFYDEDLRECGIDVAEASVYSGLCTQILREEFGLYQRKVYCFVHLSIQEHLAALYVHLSFIHDNTRLSNTFLQTTLSDLHRKAVDEALESKNGHLDLFLRFLLGLSLESNQNLLQSLMTQTGSSSSHSNEKTAKYIKQKINKNLPSEKYINLFHCLNELGDHSLVEEIQHYLKSETICENKLSLSQMSAVVFVMLTSEQNMNELNLKDFFRGNKSESLKILKKFMPVIKESRSVKLSNCNITDKGCSALASALNVSYLTKLNLSENKLGDSGVKKLSDELKKHHCKLEILRFYDCNITDEGCADLALALKSNPSHLTELNLSKNKLGDSGVKKLCDVLKNPHCKLEILRMKRCKITYDGCVALASALKSNLSHLTELNLSENKLGDSAVKRLSALKDDPQYKLEKLFYFKTTV